MFTERASCEGIDTELFYEDRANKKSWQVLELKKVCRSCPVLTECREWAMEWEVYGFWGGLTAGERHALRKQGGQEVKDPMYPEGRRKNLGKALK